MARSLRAVPGDAQPAPSASAPTTPTSIAQAAETSERELLVALRSHLAAEMDKGAVPAHALASVSAKIREYDREIRALDLREAQGMDSGETLDAEFDASAI